MYQLTGRELSKQHEAVIRDIVSILDECGGEPVTFSDKPTLMGFGVPFLEFCRPTGIYEFTHDGAVAYVVGTGDYKDLINIFAIGFKEESDVPNNIFRKLAEVSKKYK